MNRRTAFALIAAGTAAAAAAVWAQQLRRSPKADPAVLSELSGVYRWSNGEFVYLQPWNELTGDTQLVALDESGEVRTLYPAGPDRFSSGIGAGLSQPKESEVVVQRDGSGKVSGFRRERASDGTREAVRADVEVHTDIEVPNGAVSLSGTLIAPRGRPVLSTIVLVHGSGPQDRQAILPFARFLVRRGVAVFGFDKRGVGRSTGDWNAASFEDLADDVAAVLAALGTRPEVSRRPIGVLGISQAGWVMPLVARRAPDLAFLISLSGAGVPPAETTLDHARNEMLANGMRAEAVDRIIQLMTLQYAFARTGEGWEAYAAARQQLARQLGGTPPESFPATPDAPHWATLRRWYFHDPVPPLQALRAPTLAIFGALDNNILAEKNRNAWQSALAAGRHADHTLEILPRANHILLEAVRGNNAEMPTLQRFTPEYFRVVLDWLRVRSLAASQ